MASYIVRRVFYMVVLLVALSLVSFIIIQLPPGDYLTTLIDRMRAQGIQMEDNEIQVLTVRYGLDLSVPGQYLRWLFALLRGDMGHSFQWDRPVTELIGERLALTVTISLLTLILTYAMAIPIGIYSATHQYSFGDYAFTIVGFVGLATPNFLLALIMMYLFYTAFGWSVGGLFSPDYQLAGWSFGKIVDLLRHLPIPLIVIGTSGTASLIRIMRATLLDELRKNYVVTARAKGLPEGRLLIRYPIRVAINPMVSRIGAILPEIISGATLVSIVLSLPTVGPLLLRALQAQDMYLAGSMVMLLGALGVIGTLVSDMLLVAVDPRIRFERQGT